MGNQQNGIWVDYVADTGDGFDSTYSIAYLLGQKQLTIPEEPQPLQRGQVLLMGGDQVYPFASKSEYKLKLLLPYSYSFPKDNNQGASHPPLFLIPGNHDWYDGLRIFSALFCRGKSLYKNEPYDFGRSSWQNYQKRSYFAIEVANDWWIWGIDTQLTEDIDKPQSDYFYKIANQISKNAKIKIILCVSEPTWIYINKDINKIPSYNTGIRYIDEIINKELPNAKIYAVLTGDSHHYNHYQAQESGTHFITAGGGGAFLHPTHHLEDEIPDIRWRETNENLILERNNYTNEDTCFPNRKESKNLALWNWKFPFVNKCFFLILGSVYLFFSVILAALGQLHLNMNILSIDIYLTDIILFCFQNIALVILFSIFLWMGYKYAMKDNTKNRKIARIIGLLHGASQFGWLISCIYLFGRIYPCISHIQFFNIMPYFFYFLYGSCS